MESWESFTSATAEHLIKESVETTLSMWLEQNSMEAKERARICQPTRDEITRLQEKICKTLRLRDLLWLDEQLVVNVKNINIFHYITFYFL